MEINFKEDRVGGFNYELFRTISSPAAEMGETLAVGDRIEDDDTESWLSEFSQAAKRIHDRAVTYAENGFPQTPRVRSCELLQLLPCLHLLRLDVGSSA